MKRIIILLLISLVFSGVYAMEIVLTPGLLPEKIALIKETRDSELVLKGVATSADLTSLRHLPTTVEKLDMSTLKIKGIKLSKGDWFGQTVFSDGEIPSYMLLGSAVKTVSLPTEITKVGKGAFAGSAIDRLLLTKVEEIGEGAFKDCKRLTDVVLRSQRLTVLPRNVFSGCVALTNLHLPLTVTTIEENAFKKSGIREIALPALSYIGDYAFSGCGSLESVTFKNGCRIGEGAFYGTGSLEKIVGTPLEVPALSMSGTGAQREITVSSPVVGEGAFSGSLVTCINILESVREIQPYAFHSMSGLKSVVVGAFDHCPLTDPLAFEGTDVRKVKLHVRPGESGKWKEVNVWSDFIITEEGSGVGVIESDQVDIHVKRDGDRILISSSSPLRNVVLYSIDGIVSEAHVLSGFDCELEMPSGYDVIIVRVESETGTRIVKIA